MGDLSKNFSSFEFASPDTGEVYIHPDLVQGLQKLRDLIGNPIHINSAYRTAAYNKKVGGSPNSQHLFGKAADIVVLHLDISQMYHYALQIPEFIKGGIGVYPDNYFIHVDVRDNGPARWMLKNNKMIDIPSDF